MIGFSRPTGLLADGPDTPPTDAEQLGASQDRGTDVGALRVLSP